MWLAAYLCTNFCTRGKKTHTHAQKHSSEPTSSTFVVALWRRLAPLKNASTSKIHQLVVREEEDAAGGPDVAEDDEPRVFRGHRRRSRLVPLLLERRSGRLSVCTKYWRRGGLVGARRLGGAGGFKRRLMKWISHVPPRPHAPTPPISSACITPVVDSTCPPPPAECGMYPGGVDVFCVTNKADISSFSLPPPPPFFLRAWEAFPPRSAYLMKTVRVHIYSHRLHSI